MSKLTVYIAGPLSASTRDEEAENVGRAIEVWKALQAAGFAPLCPHLSWYIDGEVDLSHDEWLAVDLPWVERADVLVRIPGPSAGADMEVDHALACGVPVFQIPIKTGALDMDSIVSILRAEQGIHRQTNHAILDAIREALEFHRGYDQARIAAAGCELLDLLLRKNADYGGSAWQRPALAPHLHIGDAILCRMSDKVARLQHLTGKEADGQVEEALEETFRDLVGYGILYLARPREEA